MHSRAFLRIGGVLLLLVALMGFWEPMLAGDFLYFDIVENVGHLLVSFLMIYAGWWGSESLQRLTTWGVFVLSVTIAVGGFLGKDHAHPNFLGIANFEHPVDNVFHSLAAAWALISALRKNPPKKDL